jgi:hypothetical protein
MYGIEGFLFPKLRQHFLLQFSTGNYFSKTFLKL